MNEEQKTSSQDQQFVSPHKYDVNNKTISLDQKIQRIILEGEEQIQKSNNKLNILSQDVQFKLQQVLEQLKDNQDNSFQNVISLRMKQLAYSKILSITYQKSYFRLVQAHYHIGKQYLGYDCFQQAISHLELAKDSNRKAAQNINQKLYHSFILSYLGETYYKFGKIDEANIQLQKAVNIQLDYQLEKNTKINNIRTLKFKNKILSVFKLDEAIHEMEQTSKKAVEILGQKSKILGQVIYEQGKLQFQKNNIKKAIQYYEKAIQTITLSNQPQFQKDVIKIYNELIAIYENSNNQKHISTLKDKMQIFEDTYGNADKKTIKQQRTLANTLVKYKKLDQALDQFEDILQKQQKVYGQNSIQVGKQYRSIAYVYFAKQNIQQTDLYFKKALKIFHDLGDQKLARQIRIKLSTLKAHQ